ncbi:hypothetical protein GCM10011491_46710 [Brucella endophytica]|uniref:Uncharacterized protein n=1 Tax=Brucella endophytica TaxID=1963359 RepID=A0A916SU00_9HYPH|nr:hypothetical protein [Brucella endophytica]GGB13709.1 hypothetical protein GCM10011491_46710 [Brucella endophytica]
MRLLETQASSGDEEAVDFEPLLFIIIDREEYQLSQTEALVEMCTAYF